MNTHSNSTERLCTRSLRRSTWTLLLGSPLFSGLLLGCGGSDPSTSDVGQVDLASTASSSKGSGGAAGSGHGDDGHACGGKATGGTGGSAGSGGGHGGDDNKTFVCELVGSKTKTLKYTSVESDDLSEVKKEGGAVCASGASDCCLASNGKSAACTNLKTDVTHCGACTNACPAGDTCQAGVCVAPCPAGQTSCSGTTCSDLQTDAANCGACGAACASGLVCAAGTCISPCAPGQTFCSGACAVTQSDSANCGGCGVVCGADKVCQEGVCVAKAVAASCVPTSSLTVLLPPAGTSGGSVIAYVPNGSWEELATGVQVVPLEGSGPRTQITTPNPVNSCASNSQTGEIVCTADNNDVYLINGTTLTATLTSGATAAQSFSGGSCRNCGVAIDAANNRAIVVEGLASGGPGGFQFLDLSSNAFAAPVGGGASTSENVLFDPQLNLVLSPNEQGNYQLFDTTTSTVMNFSVPGELDSAAEDCSTGIALASDEFTGNVVLVDLSQRTTSGSTWSAPTITQNLPEFASFSAGTNGIAVVPGSHLGVVTGEFGGAGFGVIQLPATSGSGTPHVLDYAAVNMPNDPSGAAWQMGLDPHTVTAYTSPNTGKPLAVISNDARTFVALVDLAGLLGASRTSGTHSVSTSVDLVGTGVVTFVSVH